MHFNNKNLIHLQIIKLEYQLCFNTSPPPPSHSYPHLQNIWIVEHYWALVTVQTHIKQSLARFNSTLQIVLPLSSTRAYGQCIKLLWLQITILSCLKLRLSVPFFPSIRENFAPPWKIQGGALAPPWKIQGGPLVNIYFLNFTKLIEWTYWYII